MADASSGGYGEVTVTANPGLSMNPVNFVTPDPITSANIVTVDSSNILSDVTNNAPNFGSITSGGGGSSGSGGLSGLLGGANFGMIGNGIQDLFASAGASASAKAYGQAEDIAKQDVQLAKESTALQQQAASRQVYQTIGAQQAQVAGAGLASGGSAQELLRSSRQQGELTKQVLNVQGQVNVNAYTEQAMAYAAQRSAAKKASSGGLFGGITNIIGGVAGLFGL